MGKRQFKPGNMLYPVPAVLVTVADREGNSNIFTVAWAGTICTNPPMLSISVRSERHSYHMMKETGEFVVNLTLAGMDYIFTPISADKVVLESSLSFAVAIQKLLVRNEACRLAGLYLFWNMVDGREKTDLYAAYDKTIKELELPLMKTFIPDTKRYKKELSADKKAVFRSTLFPASRPLVRGSNLEELITEMMYHIKLQ